MACLSGGACWWCALLWLLWLGALFVLCFVLSPCFWPLGPWACFLLWRWSLPVPWGLTLLPCLWGPFSPLALFPSLRALLPLGFPPYVPLLSTWCPWVVWWLRFRLFLLGVLLPLWLPRSRSCARSWVPWGSRGKGGVLLGCCLAAWCLSCLLGVPLRRRPLPVVVFRLGVEAWVSGG